MNASCSQVPIKNLPPAFEQLGHETFKAAIYLFIPTGILHLSIYFYIRGYYRVYKTLTFLSLSAYWLSSVAAPIYCRPARCLQNFAVAIGTMKALDLFARRHNLPEYTAGAPLPDWHLALLLTTELRYESFSPNHIRVPRNLENFSEPVQLGIHIAVFTALQSLPQRYPMVLAFEVWLAIYIIWTSMQLVLRYKSSPALFGPLYTADSLTGFWSETWHNAFASPCTSLAYAPLRRGLPEYGVPVVFARSLGVMGAFTLMAAFHVYALLPILTDEALTRIAVFFLLNGVATVAEAAVWGHKRHWLKVVLAWVFETMLATWTASGIDIPNGLSKIPWREIC